MNVVVTRSRFEAARSEVDISEAIWAEIIYNKLDYIECKSITTENTVSSNDQDANGILHNVYIYEGKSVR